MTDLVTAARLTAKYRINANWTIAVDVEGAQGGTVPMVPMCAIHRDGSVQHFDAMLWLDGKWSIGRLGLMIPANVRRAACQIAADGMGYGAVA